MSTDPQRDADLDRLLRTQLRRESAGAAGACPDAGMLAAFVEGGVSSGERAALEAHFASCGRCQETLAAMELEVPASAPAAPEPAEARRPWLWRGHLHWLIPVGAATVLVIYLAAKPAIAPYFTPTGPAPATQTAELRPPGEVPGVSGFASRVDERPARRSQAIPAPAPAARAFEVARPELGAPPAAPGRSERERTGAAAPAFAPAVPLVPSKGERVSEAANLAQRPAPDVDAAKSASRIAATESPAGALAKDVSEERALRTAAADLIEVSAPGSTIQWRVGPEGAIWRSGDGGGTWYPQRSNVKTALLAAAAPSVTTCWAVGAAGTVLLTDDGERWERRAFPVKTDLVAVDARSAHEATVTTRDGRRFTTSDGGTTWTLQR